MASGTQIVQLDPSKLVVVTDKTHVLFDERALLAVDPKLVANIGFYGILEPVLITPEQDGKHVVIAGRQRVKAVIKANGLRREQKLEPLTCPCIIREDDAKHDGIAITENELRKEDDPMTKARKVVRFVEAHKADANVLSLAALTFGCTKQTIENYQRIMQCSPKVLAKVESGEITSTVALQVYKMPAKEQEARIEKLVKDAKAKGTKATVNAVNENKGKGRGKQARAGAGDMRKKDEVVKLLTSTIREWNELSAEQQAKDANGLRGYISVLGWMLHDEAEINEDATDALKKKGSKKVVYLIPESCQ